MTAAKHKRVCPTCGRADIDLSGLAALRRPLFLHAQGRLTSEKLIELLNNAAHGKHDHDVPLTAGERIVSRLARDGAATTKDLSEATGLKLETVQATMGRLRRQGKVRETNPGEKPLSWALAAPARASRGANP